MTTPKAKANDINLFLDFLEDTREVRFEHEQSETEFKADWNNYRREAAWK